MKQDNIEWYSQLEIRTEQRKSIQQHPSTWSWPGELHQGLDHTICSRAAAPIALSLPGIYEGMHDVKKCTRPVFFFAIQPTAQ